ncbi:hypothetical protein QBC46DRAFT_258409 [Diplogelasinospora grovesii]|uniref:RING-type domain-containing protein n=1 Tax=Diplogelasinospora grovesii TaxID=303347 RepID=A0AAN6NB42_9PEZI|nr:hypothetical protein QBC46DRAFT_258409 [Diplogelasinospora grovesii]
MVHGNESPVKRGYKPGESSRSSNNHASGSASQAGTRTGTRRDSHSHGQSSRGALFAQAIFGGSRPAQPTAKPRSGGPGDRDRDKDRDVKGKGKEKEKEKEKDHRDHRRHHKSKQAPEPPGIEVELKDLDERYSNFRFGIKPGFPAAKLEAFVRRRYQERRDYRIPETAHFRFYSEGKELGLEDGITRNHAVVWYRVTRNKPGSGDDSEELTWKFTHWQDETHGRLESALSSELARAIDSDGVTVGQLRQRIADHLGIDDAYRVVLTARGGTRAGLLQGNCWEVRQIKKHWLCRWISIDINPATSYVVLKGLGREYVYHPIPSYFEGGMELKDVKRYLEMRVFKAVVQYGHGHLKSEFNTPWTQFAFKSEDGNYLGSFTKVQWGATYTFEIPQDAAEIFADEETWLLRATETCSVCIDDKKISELPVKITEACKHQATICKDCLKQWLQSSLESGGGWDRLKCPDCPELLKYADVKRYASRQTFDRYDVLATRAALKDIPRFRWCLAPECESGQIHDDKCPKFKCAECRATSCVTHDVLWHKGETCEEYDKRNKQKRKDEKASEETIQKTSKKCPKCTKDVHKWTGCNHITCVCGHEWCYMCFAAFQRNQHGFLYCRHNTGCTERDPFIDLIDPPNGGGPPRPVPVPGGVPNFLRRPAWREAAAGGRRGGAGAGGFEGADGGNRFGGLNPDHVFFPPPLRPTHHHGHAHRVPRPPPPPPARPLDGDDEELLRAHHGVPPPPPPPGRPPLNLFNGAAALGLAAAAAAGHGLRMDDDERRRQRREINIQDVAAALEELRGLRLG